MKKLYAYAGVVISILIMYSCGNPSRTPTDIKDLKLIDNVYCDGTTKEPFTGTVDNGADSDGYNTWYTYENGVEVYHIIQQDNNTFIKDFPDGTRLYLDENKESIPFDIWIEKQNEGIKNAFKFATQPIN